MAKDRIYASKKYREAVDEMKKNDVLGFNMAEAKEIFMLAVALGLDNPMQLENRDGIIRNDTIKKVPYVALMASVLLGTVTDDAQLDTFADYEMSANLCEQCAEAGYQVLQRKYNDAGGDPELLERRMLKDLEMLFMRNVEMDI